MRIMRVPNTHVLFFNNCLTCHPFEVVNLLSVSLVNSYFINLLKKKKYDHLGCYNPLWNKFDKIFQKLKVSQLRRLSNICKDIWFELISVWNNWNSVTKFWSLTILAKIYQKKIVKSCVLKIVKTEIEGNFKFTEILFLFQGVLWQRFPFWYVSKSKDDCVNLSFISWTSSIIVTNSNLLIFYNFCPNVSSFFYDKFLRHTWIKIVTLTEFSFYCIAFDS